MAEAVEAPAVGRQALSDRHKDAVRVWVPKLRAVLEEEYQAQLERLGLRRDGKHRPLAAGVPKETEAVRRRVEALIDRDAIAEGSKELGYDNVKRELAYTMLNRLVGLKAMEARRLLYLPPPGRPEAPPEQTEVVTPVQGQARSRYLRDLRASGGSRYKYDDDAEEALLRDGLTAAFRFITREIGLLFDPEHEYASVWPTHGKLAEVIQRIHEDLPEAAYQAPDFLGWVYQFFNREEKKRVREDNKGTPRSSYELAVINQFYTPSWVVKALVDNTLGRLWIQMHPDSALRPVKPPPLPSERTGDEPVVADYLVPRTGEQIRYQRVTDEGQVATYKRASEITLLDPACGTMHFGQYAFGLFHRMYLDEIEHAGQEGWPAEPSVADRKEIPAAILKNNLFGIDIDPRAIQIASLSLLLTAKEAALHEGFSPLDVKVQHANLVVANAVDLGEERLQTLVNHLGARLGGGALRQRLFKTLWENLQHVGELGSLVQVREGVERVLEDWVRTIAKEKGLTRVMPARAKPQGTFDFVAAEEQDKAKQLELERQLLAEDAQKVRDDLLAAVEATAGEVGADPSERLFAEDTARGIKLLRALSQHYDVVVMNPPYGRAVPEVSKLIRKAFPLSYNDVYAAFIDLGTRLIEPHGYLGALVSSTFSMSIKRLRAFRNEILLKKNPLLVMLDLGPGVLDDAANETAAVVLSRSRTYESEKFDDRVAKDSKSSAAEFFDLTMGGAENANSKEIRFTRSLGSHESAIQYSVALGDFNAIDGAPLAYKRVGIAARIFRSEPPLQALADVHQGVITRDDPRYVRFFWEVKPTISTRPWKPFHKGGAFSRFYGEPDLVLDWSGEAQGAFWRLRDATIYFRPGLTWPLAAGILNTRVMREGCVFGHKGPAILPFDSTHVMALCAVLNSTFGLFLAKSLSSRENMGGRWETGILKRIPIQPDVLRSPCASMAESIYAAKAEWDRGNEVSPEFTAPWLARDHSLCSMQKRLDALAAHEEKEGVRIQGLLGEIDAEVYALYKVPCEIRQVVEETVGERPIEILWPQMEGKTADQKRMEHVWRLLSYAVKRVVEADDDGIVPFSPAAGEPRLVDRVRQELTLLFPGHDANQLEVEITNELKRSVKGYRKTSSIAEWLDNAFFEYHAGLYRNRPIFWHLASAQGTEPFAFGLIVHYHRFDKDRMKKLRSTYLRDALKELKSEAARAGQENRGEDRVELQAKVEEVEAFDRKLQQIQEGWHEGAEGGATDYRILTPWKAPDERPKGWDPDVDDGVKVNIEPLEKAGVVRIAKVT